MTEIATLRTLMLHVLVFEVTILPGHSRADHRRFFSAMHRAMDERHYRMSHCAGLCLLIPDKEQTPQAGRHAVVNWLIDQVEVRQVAIHPVASVYALINGDYFDADDQGLQAFDGEICRTLLRRIACGALAQAVLKLHASRIPAAYF